MSRETQIAATKAKSYSPNAAGDSISQGQGEFAVARQDQTDASSSDVVPAGSTDDSLEGLKAALDEDAQRAKEPVRPLGGSHDVRVRVESLLERAQGLFASGKLREARHAAQIAQDLGETARIDFSPDEERPADLLHQIDDQLKVGASGATASNSTTDEPSRAANPTDEPANRKGARRDWTYGLNVFRRDRKPNPADQPANQPVATTASPTPTSSSGPVQLGLEVDSSANEKTGNAVVQANRSVTLAVSTSTDSVSPSAHAPNESISTSGDMASRESESREESAELQTSPNTEQPDADSPTEAPWPRGVAEETRTLAIEEEPPPHEIETIHPIARFHDVARKRYVERMSTSPDQPAAQPIWGWLAGLTIFGICGIFAFFCYRRGAT